MIPPAERYSSVRRGISRLHSPSTETRAGERGKVCHPHKRSPGGRGACLRACNPPFGYARMQSSDLLSSVVGRTSLRLIAATEDDPHSWKEIIGFTYLESVSNSDFFTNLVHEQHFNSKCVANVRRSADHATPSPTRADGCCRGGGSDRIWAHTHPGQPTLLPWFVGGPCDARAPRRGDPTSPSPLPSQRLTWPRRCAPFFPFQSVHHPSSHPSNPLPSSTRQTDRRRRRRRRTWCVRARPVRGRPPSAGRAATSDRLLLSGSRPAAARSEPPSAEGSDRVPLLAPPVASLDRPHLFPLRSCSREALVTMPQVFPALPSCSPLPPVVRPSSLVL